MQITVGNSKLCDARVYGLSPVLLKILVLLGCYYVLSDTLLEMYQRVKRQSLEM